MFDKLRLRIALQFTCIVFGLLLLNGLIFIPIDYRDEIAEIDVNILQDAERILLNVDDDVTSIERILHSRDKFRVRVFDEEGSVIFRGTIYGAQEDELFHDPWTLRFQNDRFRVLTVPIMYEATVIGYLQVGEVYHLLREDLVEKAKLVFFESLILASLTFYIGRYFAERSLRPAIVMHQRLDEFAQDASHELKTPLATAASSMDLALKDSHPKEHIQSAKTALMRASHIVEKLLELAKLTTFSIQKKTVDLSFITNEVLDDLDSKATESQVHFIRDIDSHVEVQGDPVYIAMLIRNLTTNAIKFSDAENSVTVTVKPGMLQVRDKGLGIDPEHIARIFDPFYQADPTRATKGVGLGLHIVKKIVEAHQWSIDVESIKDVGTAFTIKY